MPCTPSHCLAARCWRLGLLVPAASLILAACVSVHVSDPQGGVRVVRGIGVVRVELPLAASSITGDISGVGIVQAPLGWTLGYTRQRWAMLAPDCRTVVWMSPSGMEPSVAGALSRAAGVCLMAAEGRSRASVDSNEE